MRWVAGWWISRLTASLSTSNRAGRAVRSVAPMPKLRPLADRTFRECRQTFGRALSGCWTLVHSGRSTYCKQAKQAEMCSVTSVRFWCRRAGSLDLSSKHAVDTAYSDWEGPARSSLKLSSQRTSAAASAADICWYTGNCCFNHVCDRQQYGTRCRMPKLAAFLWEFVLSLLSSMYQLYTTGWPKK